LENSPGFYAIVNPGINDAEIVHFFLCQTAVLIRTILLLHNHSPIKPALAVSRSSWRQKPPVEYA